jgi:hypothetical protein
MKRLFLAAIVLLLTACTAHEAPYVDSEFGQATQVAFEQQVVFPDNPHEGKIPEDLEGISAGELMDAYNSSFSKKCNEPKVLSIGLTED